MHILKNEVCAGGPGVLPRENFCIVHSRRSNLMHSSGENVQLIPLFFVT